MLRSQEVNMCTLFPSRAGVGCCYSVTQSCLTLCDPMDSSAPGFLVVHYLPEFAHIHVHWVGDTNQLILCCLLLLPSIFPRIKVFFSELALPIRWPKYQSFRLNISPSKEHSVLISSRMNWFDLLAVQGTLKSILQHYNSKALIL